MVHAGGNQVRETVKIMNHDDDGRGNCRWCGSWMGAKTDCPVKGQDRVAALQHDADLLAAAPDGEWIVLDGEPFSGPVDLDDFLRPMGHPANPSRN